jgi:hypothetical protein
MTNALEILAENRIAAAMAAGAFDALPGCGAPLRLEDDSSVPAEWRLAFRLLRSNGYAPDWIESGDEIRRGIAAARAGLAAVDRSAAVRPQAEAVFAARALALNRQIVCHNLHAPAPRWHIPWIDIERERVILAPGGTPTAVPAEARSSLHSSPF